jgi:dTMP kinase
MKNYNFITFEGVEGCGKSSQVKLLQEFFQAKNIASVTTREPGGVIIAEKIREILINESQISPKTELLLNFAARIEHIEQFIMPNLKNNRKVICDRFYDSTIAYQGFAMGLEIQDIIKIKEIAIANFKPDITFLLDIDVNQSLSRLNNRADNNRYDKMSIDFHNKVREGFLKIAHNNKRFVIIDASMSRKEVFEQIIAKINYD